MSWNLLVREKAKKALHRLPREEQDKIQEALDELSENPYSGDIVKLEGEENLWRRRVGAYRIKFQIMTENKTVFVYEIERRISKTY